MNRTAAALVEQVEAYAALFDRVSAGGRFDGDSSSGPIRLLLEDELLAATATLSRLDRMVQAELAQLAGDVARRSEPAGEESFARRMGASGPADLVAQVAGIPRDRAGAVVRNGEAFRPRESMQGEALPADRPHIAAAFASGLLDPAVAGAMRRTVEKVRRGLSPSELDAFERDLVGYALAGWTADQLLEYARKAPSYAWPQGNGPKEDDQAAQASVTKRVLDNGLTRWILDLDSLTNGLFETALLANTPQPSAFASESDVSLLDAVEGDARSLKKRRVDGVATMAKRALKKDEGHIAGTAVTLLVTMTEEALRTGIGTATLLGCQDTISAGVARMLAAEAEIIPVVLGSKSKVLDLGTGTRFFSEAQRRAMALRDGGCAGPGCDAPLAWCDAAHINPAGYGSTSIANGILLCWRCHLLHDKHGWQVERVDGRWWWTPPPWIDRTGSRRPGGRIPPPEMAA